MNVEAKICGIGRQIVGAPSAARVNQAPYVPRQQFLASQGVTRAQINSGQVSPPGRQPAPAATPYYGTGPSMAPMTPPAPAALASNPYNLPGLPGYNPYQPTNPASGYNAANPYNMPGYNAYAPSTQQPYSAPSYYGGGDYYAPTAADFGLPSSYDPTGGSGMSSDLSYAFSDPTDLSAMASYYDPMSQIGPWSGY